METKPPITVLVIDENPAVCAALARRISGLDGFGVIEATSNPVLAAEIAHEFSPQVIIADFKRGPRPREEMVRWMRNSSPDSALIVYAAYFVEGEREAFQQAGASRCLLKGLSAAELARELQAAAQDHHRHRNGTS
ncbi:MAG TPA: response regulator [Dehalococcoidia bacterium]|jgi:DNA-binding NarL/FixJ family response regulator|nr:response regulator [Dehalococcoidia bacterium]